VRRRGDDGLPAVGAQRVAAGDVAEAERAADREGGADAAVHEAEREALERQGGEGLRPHRRGPAAVRGHDRRVGLDRRRALPPGPELGGGPQQAPGRAPRPPARAALLVKRLRDVYQPEGVEIWLHGRNRDLGSQRPLDLLRAGEFETVLSAVERLVDGTM
jgi:hypothetical protein